MTKSLFASKRGSGVFVTWIIAMTAMMWFGSSVSAATQTWDPSLKQATSCSDVDAYLKDKLSNYWNGGYFGPVAREWMIVNDAATKAAVQGLGDWMWGWGWADFATTNTQKENVDEPDIIKNNGKNIYYLDQEAKQVRILDVATQKLLGTLTLPKQFWGANMFLQNNKLVILGWVNLNRGPSYYTTARYVYRDQQTMILVYDIAKSATPVFVQGYTYDGRLQESRVVDGNLIMTVQSSIGWQPVYSAVNDMISNTTKKSLKKEEFTIAAKDVLPQLSTFTYKVVTPKTGKPRAVEQKKSVPLDCTQVLYKNTDPKSSDNNWGYRYAFGESMTSILSLSLDNATTKPIIKTAFVNNAQVHVSSKNIYLTAPVYMPSEFACPALPNVMCMPWSQWSSYTALYKFSLKNLWYTYASLVEGTTYNQYSMDEDASGTMRVVTSNWKNNKNSSNVYAIDTAGKVIGSLKNIAPDEQFYGVRFIDKYLYLVTYKQVDPLFVIDMSQPTKPSIVAELKMPWYSNYLHPYGPMKDGVQYLIGLGYDTKTSPEWREQQVGVKLDLYKVDFSKKNAKGVVPVSQVWTKTLGEQNSQTEALYNPRMFVFNQTTKELMLPIVLTKTKNVKQCYTTYDDEGKEIKKDCNDVQQQQTVDFAWVKVWNLSETWLTEKISINYKDMIKNPYDTNNDPMSVGRYFPSMMPRVWYNGGQYYMVNKQFAQFFTQSNTGGVILFGTGK